MGRKPSPDVADVVARFFQQRRGGRRVSIDEVLSSFDRLRDPVRLRDESLRAIARQAKTSLLSRGSSDNVGNPALDGALPTDFPELAGYHVVDVIGRGGMGVVYEAYRQSTGRRVAIKFMLATAARSETGRRRFEREIELVARLQHPGIVSVIDSGINSDRYFYVMEYVEGRPLDEAFTPGACVPREVLELIATVAETVDYAHQRGVLHRDLKPSNVLIDEHGRARLLDFGLAKAIDPDSVMGVDATLSEPGQLVGTLAYMSPEQSRGDFAQMSVRSDVYSLGAMAYELLTGELPCNVDGALADVLNRIAEQDPRRPSALRRGLDGDVDAILLKALEKDPQRRYATASDLATDIRRYLADEPISARPAGPGTRVRRWVRRNRSVAAVSAVALLLIVVVTTAAFLGVMAQRDRARARGEDAQRMMHAMEEMLAAGDPDTAASADVPLRAKFPEWEAQLAQYENEPEMEAGLRLLFGRICLLHGEYERSERNLRRALALLRDAVPEPDPSRVAHTSHALARALHKLTRYPEAEDYYREALELRRQAYGPVHNAIAQTLSDLAWVVKDQDRFAEAEELYQQALAMFRSLPPGERDDGEFASAMNNWGQLLVKGGRYEEAEQLLRKTLELRRELYAGREHQALATSLANLGSCLRELGRFDEAEPLLREAMAMRSRLLGDDHETTIVSMNLYGLLLKDCGKYAEAEPVLRKAHDLRVAALGAEPHAFVAVSKHNLAVVLQVRGKHAEAERLLLEAAEIFGAVVPDFERHHSAGFVWSSLADLYREMGDFDAARALGEKSLAIREAVYSEPDHPEIGCSLLVLGRIELEAGDPNVAEPLLQRALAILHKLPAGHWRTALCQSILGECLTAQGRFDEAEQLLVPAFNTLNRRADVRNRDTRAALQRVIALYETWGKPEPAAAYRALLADALDAD